MRFDTYSALRLRMNDEALECKGHTFYAGNIFVSLQVVRSVRHRCAMGTTYQDHVTDCTWHELPTFTDTTTTALGPETC